MRCGRSLERVLCGVVDQDPCVDLFADLKKVWLGQVYHLPLLLDTYVCFGQFGNYLVPIRERVFLGLPSADHCLEHT